jgi:hypothetical protein
MSPDETKRLLAGAQNVKVRVLLSLGYGELTVSVLMANSCLL